MLTTRTSTGRGRTTRLQRLFEKSWQLPSECVGCAPTFGDRNEDIRNGFDGRAMGVGGFDNSGRETWGRPRSIDVRAVVNGIFYLLRTGCQWRLLPREFPPWPTVYYYFRRWEQESVWLTLQRSLYPLTRLKAGRRATPSVAIMDGQSVKTTEKGAFWVLTPISASEEENDIFWSIR